MEWSALRKAIRQLYSPRYLSKASLNQLVTILFPDRSSRHARCNRRFYDTFDWRLFKAGFLLEEDILNDRHKLRLRSMTENAMIIEEENIRAPQFYWDLP
ncbi:MAG: hypothetical protein R3321_09265, partial [Nitrososphaeraceae archaeon]|nr:hypothetical protein [Nitrososphaeraceae archaeon]